MPIYTSQCLRCGHVEERIVPAAERDGQRCGAMLERGEVVAPTFQRGRMLDPRWCDGLLARNEIELTAWMPGRWR